MPPGSREAIKAILLHPLSLLILGGSLLASWLFDFWYIVLLGLAVEVFIISSWSQDPKFRQRLHASLMVSRLETLSTTCDSAISSVWDRSWGLRVQDSPVARAYRSKDSIWKSFVSSPPDLQLLMEEMIELSLKSAIGFVELYRARKALSEDLKNGSLNDAMRELQRLKVRASETRDALTRTEYEKAIAYKEEEIAGYGKAMARVEALDARMDKIVAALASIKSKMAGMAAFDLHDYDHEISLLKSEATSLENAMKEMSHGSYG